MQVHTSPAYYDRNDGPYNAYAYKSYNGEITLRLAEVADDIYVTLRPDQLDRLIELLASVSAEEVEEGESRSDVLEVSLN